MSQNKNPYAQAAGAYDTHAKTHSSNQRELEARILLKSNKMMRDLIDNWDSRTSEIVAETLKYNRQIWMVFYDTALENPDDDRPNDLRSNIVNLANFIFKRETEILSNPQKEKFDILININNEISAGLMVQQENQNKTQEPIQSAENKTRTDISG